MCFKGSRKPLEPPWDPQTSPRIFPDLPGPQKDPQGPQPLETSNIKNYQKTTRISIKIDRPGPQNSPPEIMVSVSCLHRNPNKSRDENVGLIKQTLVF